MRALDGASNVVTIRVEVGGFKDAARSALAETRKKKKKKKPAEKKPSLADNRPRPYVG
jgi:hypothetical protein